MNLHSKKARIPIAALGVTALCSAGLGIFASPANAAVSLTLNPSATSATTLNFGAAGAPGSSLFNIPQPLSNATFATRVTSTGMTSLRLVVDSFTPSGSPASPLTSAPFYVASSTAGGTGAGPTASAAGAWETVDALDTDLADRTTDPFTLTSGAYGQNIHLAATEPGTYTMHFVDTGTQAGADDDNTSPTMTLTVKDATDRSPGTTDDFAPTVSNSKASVGIGDPVTGSVDFGPLTLADARGTSSGAGVLAANLNPLVGIGFGGVTGAPATIAAGTWADGKSSRTIPTSTITGTGTLTTSAIFDADGDGDFADGAGANSVGTATSTVASTGVTALSKLEATAVEGAVVNGTGTVSVKSGTRAVTYKATVANSGTATDIANKTVYFTVGGTDAASVVSSGTTVDAANHIYSAQTNASGVASITLTDNATTLAGYTVAATSNGQATGSGSNASSLTASYSAATATTIKITSTSAELTPTVGTASVTVKGKLLDQFGQTFQPATGDNVQVAVAGTGITANAVLSGGEFSYTYTPATTPTAGTPTNLTFTYDKPSGTDPSAPAVINWASAAAAASITLTTPANNAPSLDLETSAAPTAGLALAGTVLDTANVGLAFKGVKLTGGNGVWFSKAANPDADSPLVTSLDAVANGSGALTGAYVFFTKSGEHKITATSGSATVTNTVTVDAPTIADAWNVAVDDLSGAPGSTLIVTGKVTDVFGNAVAGAEVDLAQEPSTIGTLAATDDLTTNAAGVFSTTFISGSNASGDVDVTATIDNNTLTGAGPFTVDPAWAAAGVTTLKDGVDKTTSKIKVAATKLTISSTAKLTAGARGGSAKLSGTYLPNTSVDIYARESGEKSYGLVDSVETDAEGEWGTSQTVDKSTRFLARSNGLSSPSVETQVWSAVNITAKAEGKGRVLLSANGDPNALGTLSFYRSIAGADPLLKRVTSNSTGSAKVRVILPKGSRSVYVTYKAPGTGMGQSKTLKVNVK